MTLDQFIDAWEANDRANSSLLALLEDADFELKPGKGKTIRSNFTHIVSVRKMWCEDSKPNLGKDIPKLDWKTATREQIVEGLEISNRAMIENLSNRLEKATGKNVLKFFAYAVAHEAHHRSQIEIALRINGREPEDTVLYKLWDW